MEPTLLPKTHNRHFSSESEYRLWQMGLRERLAPARPGLVRRLVSGVRSLMARPSREQVRRPAARPKHQTQTMARVDSAR